MTPKEQRIDSRSHEWRLRYFKRCPWVKHKYLLTSRCKHEPKYIRKGIKDKITADELKEIWFRDKAYNLKRPSTDRIDSDGDYTKENCRFIELSENSRNGVLERGAPWNKGKKCPNLSEARKRTNKRLEKEGHLYRNERGQFAWK